MISVGAASQVINNELGRPVQGASVDNSAEYVRDDLEANALYLSNGSQAVLLISCDLAGVTPDRTDAAREAVAEATGIDSRSVIIAGTHTHSGPSVIPTNYLKPVDSDYLDRLQGWLVDVAQRATESAQPARIGWGLGAAQIGYNRRCCWADGSHSMHGDTTRRDFTGLEGPEDPRHFTLFAVDGDGKLLAVLHNNTSHPTCFYGANFYSADYPGRARQLLREALGPLPVLYLNGAFGDISIESQLARPPREGREQKMNRAALLLAGETLRMIHEAPLHDGAALGHAFEDISVSVRLPDAARLAWARETLAKVDAGQETAAWDRMWAYGIATLQDDFGDDPVETAPVHAIRIGDAALVTQPCELYCQFGIDIKRRSPTPTTAVCGIADGYRGYCPTTPGVLGGGYSGEPKHWRRLADDAGYRIVDTAARLLHQLWKE